MFHKVVHCDSFGVQVCKVVHMIPLVYKFQSRALQKKKLFFLGRRDPFMDPLEPTTSAQKKSFFF